jgi:predicted Zn-dependent peptidase
MNLAKNKQSRIRNSAIRAGLILTGVVAGTLPALAQAPGDSKAVSVSKVERKNRAPVSKEILLVKLPQPVQATLANGVTVLILEDHRFPIVTVDFTIDGAGALWEPSDQHGLAGVTAQMLREGTSTRSSKQINEDIDRLGASFFASAPFGDGDASVGAAGLSDNFDQWFPLTTDLMLNASFPADELAKLKQRLKVQLVQQRQQPNFLTTERFSEAVYGSHPAATVAGTPESIDALTSDKLAQWHKERYAPQNTLLGITGDVNAKELIVKLNQWFAKWPKTSFQVPPTPGTTEVKDPHVYIVDRPNSVQTTLAMGNIAITRTSPDYPSMVVMDQILGAGAAARLFLNLREAKGYTYGVYSSFTARKYAGPFRAGGDLRTEVTDGAMKEFWIEFNRIRDEKVPADELDDARRAVVAGFALSLEQPEQLLNFAEEQKIYNLPADYWDKYPAQISAVSADDVQNVARKYVDPANMQVVGVGDAKKIAPVLQKYGPVKVFDTQGKPEEARPATN